MKADRAKVTRLLKTARGQLDGILKMVDDDRYCIDIANQILATESILHKVSREVLRAHMQDCVKEAVMAGNSDEKIDEILALVDKISK
ncbi:DNA-binding FrmR family transcriptional regulator [Hydrogenoanaerobacterium saccharovorans]|uniref:Copper-sensing transcriptional repressor CsoR n=1 Tax=Hydrogenoanaerobacterium saccharovorans TaxID=474960 RepID=A0A1H7ZVJ8_9FIRM|nr:metal-sensing transcriptional repressor [Hydrogenoanaerobacterium saccharovorans]RPF48348.1 DNA-binding FrmR family transcriptional regulator [Hydrogenoanaerobacterium saccharovorans]SEM62480.1 DNA-binding transcriptional regulator, FrmR family [Hydrogenoanaerobacterium saccharovorans]